MAKVSPTQFVQEVRQEAAKVTWPTRRETGISTAMVLAMVFVAAMFFFLVDQLLGVAVKALFGIGG